MVDNVLGQINRVLLTVYTKSMFRMSTVKHAPLPEGPKILVVNHPTTTDPFVILTTMREQMRILVHQTLFNVPVFGLYLRISGHIIVDPKDGNTAYLKALRTLQKGKSVVVFIEGGITEDVVFQKPKTGAVRLAMNSGAPIVPIGVGVDPNHVHCMTSVIAGKKEIGRWYIRGKYAVTMGKPIRYTGTVDNWERVRTLSNDVMNTLRLLAKESVQRIHMPCIKK